MFCFVGVLLGENHPPFSPLEYRNSHATRRFDNTFLKFRAPSVCRTFFRLRSDFSDLDVGFQTMGQMIMFLQ